MVKKIICVYDYSLQEEYVIGADYEVVDGKVKGIKGGRLPYMSIDDYYLKEPAKFAKVDKLTTNEHTLLRTILG